MSWQMPAAGPWNTPMATMDTNMTNMNMGSYTPEQWSAMQQQNWHQWSQWQQQYAHWQQQYGDKYTQQLQSMQAMATVTGVPPPPPNAAPPAPPPPDKPPPPPHENNQPLYGKQQGPPPPTPVAPVQPPNQQSTNINSENATNNHQNWSNNTQTSQAPANSGNTEALNKLAEEERLFDIKFRNWEEEIEKWKSDNVNHPDKKAYSEYEEKFEACRAQLLQRRQQMKDRRARLLGHPPPQINTVPSAPVTPATGSQNKVTAVPNKYDQNTSNDITDSRKSYEQKDNRDHRSQNYTNQSNQYIQQQRGTSRFERGDRKNVDFESRNESYNDLSNDSRMSESPLDSNFLPSSNSNKEIPGLDLVPEKEKFCQPLDINDQTEVIDITDDAGQKSPSKKAPDYTTISMGINSILGDEKIMNMLSMVSKNIPNKSMETGGSDHYNMFQGNYQDRNSENNQNLPSQDNFQNMGAQSNQLNPSQLGNFNNMPPQGNRQNMPPQGNIQNMPPQGNRQNIPPQGNRQNIPPQGNRQNMPPLGNRPNMPTQGNYNNIPPQRNNQNMPPQRNYDSMPPQGNYNNMPQGYHQNMPPQDQRNRQNMLPQEQRNRQNLPPQDQHNRQNMPSQDQHNRQNMPPQGNQNSNYYNNQQFDNRQNNRQTSDYSQNQNNDSNYQDVDCTDEQAQFSDYQNPPPNMLRNEQDNTFNNMPQGSNRDQYNSPQGRPNNIPARATPVRTNMGGSMTNMPPRGMNMPGPRPNMGQFPQGHNVNRPAPQNNVITQPPPMVVQPPEPKWIKEPLFTPSIIVEYEHKALRLKARDFIEPVHTFDYNHLSKDGENKKDFEREVEDLFSKYRRRDSDTRFDREPRDLDRRIPRDDFVRDDFRSRPMRSEFDDRRDDLYGRRLPPIHGSEHRFHRGDERPWEKEVGRTRDRSIEFDRERPRERDYEKERDRFRERDNDREKERQTDKDLEFRDLSRDRHGNRRETGHRGGRDDKREDKRDDRRDRRDDRRRSRSRDRDSRKRGRSRESEVSDSSAKSKKLNPEAKVFPDAPRHVVMIDDLLELPGREMRPEKIVIILRGPPGSGKSYVAKLIRDREAEQGGTVRIMSIDDYFMQEVEVEEPDPVSGKMVKKPSMKYEYDESQEEAYMTSLKRALKRSITDGYFTFLIFDAINDQLKSYADVWNFARQSNFQVYICTMDLDPQLCFKRNIHNRTKDDIDVICARFFPTPAHHIQLDATTLLQNAAIEDVQMEDVNDEVEMEDVQEVETSFTSKWERMDDANQLARLDGTNRPLRSSQLSMEDYLQLDDWKPTTAKPGKKSVRWADLEERREQEKMRAIGFVVGKTDWNRMTDPTMGSSALTKTKYIERVRR